MFRGRNEGAGLWRPEFHEHRFSVSLPRHAQTMYVFELVIHGGAKRAETLADNWARERKVERKEFSADWVTPQGGLPNPRPASDGRGQAHVGGGRATRNRCRN